MVWRLEQCANVLRKCLKALRRHKSGYGELTGSHFRFPYYNRGDTAICVQNLESWAAARWYEGIPDQLDLDYQEGAIVGSYFRTWGQRKKTSNRIIGRRETVLELYEKFPDLLDGESSEYLTELGISEGIPICEVKVEER